VRFNLTWDQTVVVTVIVGTLAAASLLSVLGARRYLRKAGAPP
jgi:predicted lysophospholipase L1 biosynthesis ABC-type transport system permease subunit